MSDPGEQAAPLQSPSPSVVIQNGSSASIVGVAGESAKSFFGWLYQQPPVAVFATLTCFFMMALAAYLGIWVAPSQLDKITEGYEKIESSHVKERAEDRVLHREQMTNMLREVKDITSAQAELINRLILRDRDGP